MFSKRLLNISGNHSSVNCWIRKIIQTNKTDLYMNKAKSDLYKNKVKSNKRKPP